MSDKKEVSEMSVLELKAAVFDCQEVIRQHNHAVEVFIQELNKRLSEQSQEKEE